MKILAFGLCAALTLLATDRGARAAGRPRLRGTFLQLTRANADWDEEHWQQLFTHFRELGLREVVVQWTVLDEDAFYSSEAHKSVSRPPLETIFKLADRAGMLVVVGLAADSEYWTRIERDPVLVDVYLRRLQLRSQAVARELAPAIRQHPSFAGWYLPEEIDDVNWTAPRAREVLAHHLHHLTSMLRDLSPAPVAVSGFSNGNLDPQHLASFWSELVEKSGIDRLMFQDGVGAGKLSVDDVEIYYEALQRALHGSCEFQIVVETFTQVGGPPLDTDPFKAKPAALSRIRKQVDLAAQHTAAPLLAFSAPDYMTPAGGPDAARLYDEYLTLLKEQR